MLLGNPLRARSLELQQACLNPQDTHRLLHTPGVMEVHNSRRQAADKSYIFCAVPLGGGGRGDGHDLSAPAGISVRASRFSLHLKVCTSVLMRPQVWNRRVRWWRKKRQQRAKEERRPGSYHSVVKHWPDHRSLTPGSKLGAGSCRLGS